MLHLCTAVTMQTPAAMHWAQMGTLSAVDGDSSSNTCETEGQQLKQQHPDHYSKVLGGQQSNPASLSLAVCPTSCEFVFVSSELKAIIKMFHTSLVDRFVNLPRGLV